VYVFVQGAAKIDNLKPLKIAQGFTRIARHAAKVVPCTARGLHGPAKGANLVRTPASPPSARAFDRERHSLQETEHGTRVRDIEYGRNGRRERRDNKGGRGGEGDRLGCGGKGPGVGPTVGPEGFP